MAMENSGGWIKLHRKLLSNPVWLREPFTAGQAWVDLLLLANHKPGVIWKRGIMVPLERGQVGHSATTLAARWRWSRGRVNRFIRDLKMMQQIEPTMGPQNKNVTSLISIINYDLYQTGEPQTEPQMEPQAEPQADRRRYTNKKEKKERKNNYSDFPDFISFYEAYPKREGKAPALKSWIAINPGNGTVEIIMSALERQKHFHVDRELKYWPLPATWLNQRRWEDELPDKPKSKWD